MQQHQQKYPGVAQGGVVMTQQYPNAAGGMMPHHMQQQQQGGYPPHYNAQYANSPLPPLPDSQQSRSSLAGSPPPNYPQGRGPFGHHTPMTPGNPSTAPSHFSTPAYGKIGDGKPLTPANTSSNAPGGLSSSNKRKQRPGHATGYILFAATCHPKVRAQLPQLSFGEISKKVFILACSSTRALHAVLTCFDRRIDNNPAFLRFAVNLGTSS